MTLLHHDQLALLAAGDFHPILDEDDDDDDDNVDVKILSPTQNKPHLSDTLLSKASPPVLPSRENLKSKEDVVQTARPKLLFPPGRTEVNVGGERTIIKDIHIAWKGNKKKNNPLTHEITYDTVNGFDSPDYCYVSGFSSNQFARVNINDPTKQQLYRFDLYDPKDPLKKIMATPHTLRFVPRKVSKKEIGMLWVGLEYAGRIVKVNMIALKQRYEDEGIAHGDALSVTEKDFIKDLDVRIYDVGGSTPHPINTNPHGFCFDKECTHIWFTGKLTNTVGSVEISTGKVKHYQLPTLGAVPIYLASDSYGDVWGTCLANNIVYRVTKEGIVTELPITTYVTQSRPIAIKRDPKNKKYMWFTNEAGHSVCRIDIEKLNQVLKEDQEREAKKREKRDAKATEPKVPTSCTCSQACKKRYKASAQFKDVITTYNIPGGLNFILGGLAFDSDNNLWVQSYYNNAKGIKSKPAPFDSIIKIDKTILDSDVIDGVLIVAYQVPTKVSILHRITEGPKGNILFTELGSNRIGKLSTISDHNMIQRDNNNNVLQQTDNISPIPDEQERALIEPDNDDANENSIEIQTTTHPPPVADAAAFSPIETICKRYGNVKVDKLGKRIKGSKKQITWEFARGLVHLKIVMKWSQKLRRVEIKMHDLSTSNASSNNNNSDPIVVLSSEQQQNTATTTFGKELFVHRWVTPDDSLRMQILASRNDVYELTVNEELSLIHI